MARTETWKLVFYQGEAYGELYDLERDPDELYNLYDDSGCGRVRGEMVERMMDWRGRTARGRGPGAAWASRTRPRRRLGGRAPRPPGR